LAFAGLGAAIATDGLARSNGWCARYQTGGSGGDATAHSHL